jgi:hypothetical protein
VLYALITGMPVRVRVRLWVMPKSPTASVARYKDFAVGEYVGLAETALGSLEVAAQAPSLTAASHRTLQTCVWIMQISVQLLHSNVESITVPLHRQPPLTVRTQPSIRLVTHRSQCRRGALLCLVPRQSLVCSFHPPFPFAGGAHGAGPAFRAERSNRCSSPSEI